jgi:DNA-binding response OmpR family regulator
MKRILIIDDDLAFSDMLSEILKDEGFDVLVEHDGMRGYECATTEHPDLVMCDVMMPGMSGIDLLTKLREDAWGSTVPVILLTNMTQPEAMAQIQLGSAHTECLLKTDWTLDKLAEKLKTLLA